MSHKNNNIDNNSSLVDATTTTINEDDDDEKEEEESSLIRKTTPEMTTTTTTETTTTTTTTTTTFAPSKASLTDSINATPGTISSPFRNSMLLTKLSNHDNYHHHNQQPYATTSSSDDDDDNDSKDDDQSSDVNEETKTKKKKKKKKNVKFSKRPTIHYIEHVVEMSSKDRSRLWFDMNDFRAIELESQKIIQAVESGKDIDTLYISTKNGTSTIITSNNNNNNDRNTTSSLMKKKNKKNINNTNYHEATIRGLEKMFTDGAMEYIKLHRETVCSVLEEQEYLRTNRICPNTTANSNNNIDDWNEISKVYSETSYIPLIHAQQRAKQDHNDVIDYMNDPNINYNAIQLYQQRQIQIYDNNNMNKRNNIFLSMFTSTTTTTTPSMTTSQQQSQQQLQNGSTTTGSQQQQQQAGTSNSNDNLKEQATTTTTTTNNNTRTSSSNRSLWSKLRKEVVKPLACVTGSSSSQIHDDNFRDHDDNIK